jgi:hypothetical protein
MNGLCAMLSRMALCSTCSKRKSTAIWLDEVDRAALANVDEHYGVATDSDVIRLAVHLLAESKRVNVEPASDERKS